MASRTGQRWDEQTDVLVVGYGAAGSCAAIAARDAGVETLLLEKQPADTPTETRHTPNARLSGGTLLCPSDLEESVLYLEGMVTAANETLDEERKCIVRGFAKYLRELKPWLDSLGFEWAMTGDELSPTFKGLLKKYIDGQGRVPLPEYPELPGARAIFLHFPRTQGAFRDGAVTWRTLSQNVAKREIPVLWETPAVELVTNGDRVQGVIAQRAGKRIAIAARRAVVLASGGFEFNEALKEHYLRAYPATFYGNPANTGDGVAMCQRAGAALWHMNCATWRAVMRFGRFAFAPNPLSVPAGEIFVDRRGKRFASEVYRTHSFGYELAFYDSHGLCYPRIPIYWIFDEKRMRGGPLPMGLGPCNPPGGVMGPNYYRWSEDNGAELEKGWIMKGRTVADLASAIGKESDGKLTISPSVLEETVKTYNRYSSEGRDPDFHRPASTLVPLDSPPFYAVRLWLGGSDTQGGPKRNIQGQVLRPDNTPIPGLYSAGDLGSFWGMLSHGGGPLAESYAVGHVAGANAAAEKLWTYEPRGRSQTKRG